ncbi:DUF6497 family protein [Arenibacterium sp. CAU 1754]
MIHDTQYQTARAIGAAPAAPAGGACSQEWGRGCGFGVVLALAATLAEAQEALSVPSGQLITLNEVLLDDTPGETWLRFRFIAPRIARGAGAVVYDVAAIDMEHLCHELVIPYVDDYDLSPARVVISLSDRAVPFGDTDPDATQFFETFRLEDARCIWEEF